MFGVFFNPLRSIPTPVFDFSVHILLLNIQILRGTPFFFLRTFFFIKNSNYSPLFFTNDFFFFPFPYLCWDLEDFFFLFEKEFSNTTDLFTLFRLLFHFVPVKFPFLPPLPCSNSFFRVLFFTYLVPVFLHKHILPLVFY